MIFFVLIKFILFIIKFLAKNSILQAIFAVGVIASSHANTVIVTGQGIDKVTKIGLTQSLWKQTDCAAPVANN